MRKQEFLAQLRKGLSGLPQNEIEEHLNFYSEMIDDRMEEGLSEEDAVAAIGSVDEIVAQTISNTPFSKIAKERLSKRRLNALEIVLLILSAPIWLSLVIGVAAVIFSLYVSLWSIIVSLWSVFASVVGSAVGGIVSGLVAFFTDSSADAATVFGAGLICAGLSILIFFVCKAVTKGLLLLTKKFGAWLKSCFIRKEKTQ